MKPGIRIGFAEGVLYRILQTLPGFRVEEKGERGAGGDTAYGECCQEILFEKQRNIRADREAVAVQDMKHTGIGFVVDRVGEYPQGKVGARLAGLAHLGFDKRTEVVERYITAVGVVTLREDDDAAGGGQRNIDIFPLDGDGDFTDSRRKYDALGLVCNPVSHAAKLTLQSWLIKDREKAVNPGGSTAARTVWRSHFSRWSGRKSGASGSMPRAIYFERRALCA